MAKRMHALTEAMWRAVDWVEEHDSAQFVIMFGPVVAILVWGCR